MANATSGASNHTCPVRALSTKTQKLICDSLSTLMILPAENGLLRDWRGLAELLGISITLVEKDPQPAGKLFDLIMKPTECKYTVEILLTYLESLDRFDIIDDCNDLITMDVQQFHSIQNERELANNSQLSEDESYDAMVLYAESDADFAYMLVDNIEKNYNMKLFIKDRNLRAGDRELLAALNIIAEHSNKLIVILSPDFLTCSMNEFLLDYATNIAIEQKMRKIIPCILTRCELPKQIMGLHTLTYTTNHRWGSFWSRLADAIEPKRSTIVSQTCAAISSSSITPDTNAKHNSEFLSTTSQTKCDSKRTVSNLNTEPKSIDNKSSQSPIVDDKMKITSPTKKRTVPKFVKNVTKLFVKKEKSEKEHKKKKEKIAVAL